MRPASHCQACAGTCSDHLLIVSDQGGRELIVDGGSSESVAMVSGSEAGPSASVCESAGSEGCAKRSERRGR